MINLKKAATLRIVVKKVAVGVGSVVLILLYLFFIFWIETFRNLGSEFPYLLIFLLPSVLIGWRSRGSVTQTLVRGGIPFILAVVIFSIYVVSLSGQMRFVGWVRDMGLLILFYAAAASLLLYLGWFFKHRAGRMRKWVVPVVCLLFVATTILQFYSPNYSHYFYIREGAESFLCQNLEDRSYQETFDILCEYLGNKYPYFEYKNMDWEKIKKEAQNQLTMVENNEDFYKVVDGVLDSLHDRHVFISVPERESTPRMYGGARGISIHGKMIVVEIAPNSPAERAGLKQGMEIVSIDGKPVEESRVFLFGPTGSRISLSCLDLDGKERTIEVDLPETWWGQSSPQSPITCERLPEGYGYIKIKWMAVDLISFVPAFDRALGKLWDTNGLIIDIRGNPGGAIMLTDQILGRFTDRKVNYGGMRHSEGKFTPLYVVPRHPIYRRRVVVLIDERCVSAADYFSYAASHLDKITLVGRPTAGVVSSPSKMMRLPGGADVYLVASGLTDPSGNFVVEDVGVQPDVLVPYTISDIRLGVDQDLLIGIKILQKDSDIH